MDLARHELELLRGDLDHPRLGLGPARAATELSAIAPAAPISARLLESMDMAHPFCTGISAMT
jgi:hypothetical protein